MKVSIQVLGSLGDVMPFITTARRLKALGADVSILAPQDYTTIILDHGIAAAPPPAFSLASWNHEAEQRGTLAGPFNFLRDWNEMVVPYVDDIMAHALQAAEGADAILANGICAPAKLAAEFSRIPYLLHALQPVIAPTGEIPCAMVWRPWQGRLFNRAGYGTVWAAQKMMEQALKPHRTRLGLRDMPPLDHTRTHLDHALPRITSVSPALLPHKPADWKAHDHLLPYPSLDLADPAVLPADARAFAAAGAPPLYIGLGSLEAETPDALIDAVFSALDTRDLRAFVSAGIADRLSPQQRAKHHVIGHVPHAALFPLCGAILHHGGAGTLDTALRAGIPQVILPQRLDQFWHAKRLQEIGVAPAPLVSRSVAADAVGGAFDLVLGPGVQMRARELAGPLRERDGARELAELTISETERFRRSVK